MASQRTGMEYLARGGYAARGVVYLIVGGLAVVAAFGPGGGGGTTDSKGAPRTLMAQPWGDALLALVGVGLLGFAIWRFLQGFADADGHGDDGRALAKRTIKVGSGVVYLGLAVFAVGLIWGTGGGGGDSEAQGWTARLLAQPFGQWMVGMIGAGVVAGAMAMAVKAWQGRFMNHLQAPPEARWVERLGMAGYGARAVVFTIIGAFLIVAALQAQAGAARGFAGALETLQGQPWGWVLLGVVALGLVAFGAFSLVQAVYRRVAPPRMSPTDLSRPFEPPRRRGGLGI